MPHLHTIQSGDCLASVACAEGFLPDTIWQAPENEGLRAKRKDPYTLLPGDELTIPDKRPGSEEAATEKRHRFRRKAVPAKLRILLRDKDDKPRSSVPYTAIIEGVSQGGETDKDGAIELTIPPNARAGRLMVGKARTEVYPLDLGGIDPIDSISGAQQRLSNLGYPCDYLNGEMDETTRAAIRSFQEAQKLEPSGEHNKETQDKLKEIYGC
jgi:hypothetical protein